MPSRNLKQEEIAVSYRTEINERNRQIAALQERITELNKELDQLWRDEGIANVGHEVPIDNWGKPSPMRCRKCRKEPVVVSVHQRQVDAIVDGKLTRVWQDYYRYATTKVGNASEAWCHKCQTEYFKQREQERLHFEFISRYDSC